MVYLDIVNIVLLSVVFVCFISQLIYYWFFLLKPYKYQKGQENIADQPTSYPPVSIVITGRNEAAHIEKNFPSILEQDYPQYEVIFVNDASTDDTEEVVKRLAIKYPHFYYTYIPEGSKNLSRKKLALTMGIKAAKYDRLLFTEPDCYPATREWIKTISVQFSDKKRIVLGFARLENPSSKYIAYDYFLSNLQMLSLALFNKAYTGNGRNLSYCKQYFEEQQGFKQSNFLDIGEDDLFINQIAKKDNVAVALSQESQIAFEMNNARYWIEFKIHKNITRKFYKKFAVYFWRGEKLSRILYYISFFFSFIYFILTSQWILFGAVAFTFLVRLFSQLYVINKTALLLMQLHYYFSLPFLDLAQLFVDAYFSMLASLKAKNNYNWKYEKRG